MQDAKLKEIYFFNGKFLSLPEAKISILEPGFLYGFGVFETMRAYNNKIVYFNQHLERLKNSSQLIGIKPPYSISELKEIIKKTIKINALGDVYVRLTLWRSLQDTGTLVTIKKYQPYSTQKYRKGFSVGVSRLRQDENSFLAQIKSTSRLLYELAYKEIKLKGFDEAIILNSRGYVAETSRSNIFLVKDNRIFTPALRCGCLNGITRQVIFDLAKKYNFPANEANFVLQDLYEADEVFLTNSLMGIMPLRRIERKEVGKGPNSVTRFFMQKYNQFLYETQKNKITL